jgi:aminoglycoside phosphotransferase (APT) family kinase protein
MSSDFSGTMPLPENSLFDVARLDAYVREQIPGLCLTLQVEQFRGGQSNPTFLLTFGSRRFVLRKKPPGEILPSAHAVDREYRVIKALASCGVPVPPAYCLCEDPSVIGTMFYIMGHIEGRSLWDSRLPDMTPAQRGAIYDELNCVIAMLHQVDFRALGLEDYGKPGNYFARQISRWTKQYRASATETIGAFENLIHWLPQHIPPGDETTLVHGDFRLDNVIFHATEPRILAVVDWELSTLGHPLADFAYHVMAWRLEPEVFRGLAGVNFAELGIPTEAAYIARYCQRTGREPIDPASWSFYLAYNMFRVACIRQGIMKRALRGNAASKNAASAGQRARAMAESAWRYIQNDIGKMG